MFLGEIIYKLYVISYACRSFASIFLHALPETTADREAENESVSQCDTG